MRFARFKQGTRIAYGIVRDGTVEEISSTPFLPYEPTGVAHALEDIRLLAPCIPSKVVAIALNYVDHIAEMGMERPRHPVFFYKPSTSVIGPRDGIVAPPGCKQLDYEGELGVVIGSVARKVDVGRWREAVLGFTCAVDATARDFQQEDHQWGRAKGFDTSAPIGPWIETDLEPSRVRLVTRLNGEVKQDGNTSDLVFGVPELVAFVTAYVTLLPGDVIMTGTPRGVGPLTPGDELEVEVEGVGTLSVPVRGISAR
ncbi:MAG: fumarylacetoacetate hydrolase family protein [Actinomycetota bacterium]|nr:fumarylacetoacetate hydrolase family protein [Actinomycetota bacterium]